MNIKEFGYWWPRIMIAAFSVGYIYLGMEVLIFIIKFFANPAATSAAYFPDLPATVTATATTIDWEGVIGGAICTLFLIAWGIVAIVFAGWHLANVIWNTTMDILDEVLKGYGYHYPASWMIEDIYKRGDFSKCWAIFPMQLH